MWPHSVFNWRERVQGRGFLWRPGQIRRKRYPGVTHQPVHLLQGVSFPHHIWPGPGGHSVWQCHLQSAAPGKVHSTGTWCSHRLHSFLTFNNTIERIPHTYYNLNGFENISLGLTCFFFNPREGRKLYENSRVALWAKAGWVGGLATAARCHSCFCLLSKYSLPISLPKIVFKISCWQGEEGSLQTLRVRSREATMGRVVEH